MESVLSFGVEEQKSDQTVDYILTTSGALSCLGTGPALSLFFDDDDDDDRAIY